MITKFKIYERNYTKYTEKIKKYVVWKSVSSYILLVVTDINKIRDKISLIRLYNSKNNDIKISDNSVFNGMKLDNSLYYIEYSSNNIEDCIEYIKTRLTANKYNI